MQVLMRSNVKFVSAVDVRLLTSFLIHLWFSYSFRSYWKKRMGERKGGREEGRTSC